MNKDIHTAVETRVKKKKKDELKSMVEQNKHKFVTNKYQQPFYEYVRAQQNIQKKVRDNVSQRVYDSYVRSSFD